MTAERIVDTPVPRRGFDDGLQGFPPGQSSAASSEQTVDIPVPHGGQHDLHPPSAADFSNPPGTADQGVFRAFPWYKKVRRSAHSVVRECPGSRARGSMSSAGVLAYFRGERHGVRLRLLAEWFGLGVTLPGVSSYPVVQKLSPVWTGHGVVYTRQSTDASGRISLSVWLARAVCIRKHGALFRCGPRIWQSLSLCLGACGVQLDFCGRCLGRNAWFASWMVSVVFGCCLWSKLDFCGDATAQFLVRQWMHVLRQLREVL